VPGPKLFMCGRRGCTEIGEPVAVKRCEVCRYRTLPWDPSKSAVLKGEAVRRFDDAIAVITNCRVLGGHGLPPQPRETWEFVFLEDGLLMRAPGKYNVTVPYSDVTTIEIGGPGERKSGGGFFGGGFGLAGAAEGILVATALNLLTTKTSIRTVICLQTSNAELFAHNGDLTPDALRMQLSPVFTLLRQRTAASATAPGEELTNTVDRLSKLAELLDRGLIDDAEFRRLKSELLG
jgi:hypothetical protein